MRLGWQRQVGNENGRNKGSFQPLTLLLSEMLPDEVGERSCCRTVQSWLWFVRLGDAAIPLVLGTKRREVGG
jgi:hypothetical protein